MKKTKLAKIDPSSHPLVRSKEEAAPLTAELQKSLYDLLYLMFAHGKHSLLIILHGIDTSGKDGSVRHIFNGANPQGMRVFSFKKPTPEEFKHDFLWRCHVHAPESGLATIFNRSYYEEVTTSQVHPEMLNEQFVPDEILKSKDFFEHRYRNINDFENMLGCKGTVVVKFLLHISKKEQKKRISERLKDRSKNWKFSDEDIKEREYWDEYMKVFEKMINKTSTARAPWTVVPADHKWYRDYVISKTLVEELSKLKMSFPKAKAPKKKLK